MKPLLSSCPLTAGQLVVPVEYILIILFLHHSPGAEKIVIKILALKVTPSAGVGEVHPRTTLVCPVGQDVKCASFFFKT